MYKAILVDDERAVLEGLLASVPWSELNIDSVRIAMSGPQALELQLEEPADLVISDISMPEMSGLELVQELKSRWPRIKCMLLSGLSEFTYAQEAMKNKVSGYLLKPVRDDELYDAIRSVTEEIRAEWEQIASYESTLSALRDNLPLLRSSLLSELLQGRLYSEQRLLKRLAGYRIPFAAGQPFAMILIRFEDESDTKDLPLFEYAVLNIFEEMAREAFYTWHCVDVHDYTVILVTPKNGGPSSDALRNGLETAALQTQTNVSAYLKKSISILTTAWDTFPYNIAGLYQSAITTFQRLSWNQKDMFFALGPESPVSDGIEALGELHHPPTLGHLLEAGRWDEAQRKLDVIFSSMDGDGDRYEMLLEVYFSLSSTFIAYFHKNGKEAGSLFEQLDPGRFLPFQHLQQLVSWAFGVLKQLRQQQSEAFHTSRSELITKVQKYVQLHLHEDISHQTIAEHLYIHPVTLSRMYKSETGEKLSDYIVRLKMEKAAYLITHTNDKIYEIAQNLGYQNPPYFIMVFKKRFGIPPQEYRFKYRAT